MGVRQVRTWKLEGDVLTLCAQHLGFGKMRNRAAGQRGQGLPGQLFRARNISRSRFGHKIEHPGR